MLSKWILMLLVCGLVASAAPVVLYTNLGPGDTWVPNQGWTLGDGADFGNGGFGIAMGFTPSEAASLESVELALTWETGPQDLSISLMADDNGTPGTVIESYVVSFSTSWPGALVTAASLTHPLLQAGTTYWLGAMPVDPVNTGGVWMQTSPPVLGLMSYAQGGSPWAAGYEDLQGAFRISGDNGEGSVPEPAAFLLMGAGLLGLSLLRRKRA